MLEIPDFGCFSRWSRSLFPVLKLLLPESCCSVFSWTDSTREEVTDLSKERHVEEEQNEEPFPLVKFPRLRELLPECCRGVYASPHVWSAHDRTFRADVVSADEAAPHLVRLVQLQLFEQQDAAARQSADWRR